MTNNVWFISGASSGFGKAIVYECLRRGDSVIASSRRATSLHELGSLGALLVDLDVTSPDEAIRAAFQRGVERFGRITHFVNAPGYILVGAIESATAREAADSMAVNVLGVMNMTRNEVALLRPQGYGVIANFGSVGSWYGGPAFAYYAAAKWAVSGFTESLHEEVKDFGIKATVVEPGYFRTGFLKEGGGNRIATKNGMEEEYKGTGVETHTKMLAQFNGHQPGDVEKGAGVIVDVLTGTGVAAGKEVPIRILLGQDCVNDVRAKMERTEKLIQQWEPIFTSTDHDDVGKA